VTLERDFRYLTRIGRESRVDFELGRVLRRRWRRSGGRVESDQADGAKFGVGTDLGLSGVPRTLQVVIVRSGDQLNKDHQGRCEDRGDRAMPAPGGFGSADQNRSFGRLLVPDCYSQRSRCARPALLNSPPVRTMLHSRACGAADIYNLKATLAHAFQ
jgi:hypothetical protein